MATFAELNKYYLAYFGRPVDYMGSIEWADNTPAEVEAAFAASNESNALYASTDLAGFINSVYVNVIGRNAELNGLNYWVDQIVTGKVTKAGAAIAILNDALLTDDKTSVQNKLKAAEDFFNGLDTAEEIVAYSGAAAAASARTFIAGVTSTPATAAEVDAALVAVGKSSTAGVAATFTLTTGADLADTAGAYRNGSDTPFDFKFTSGNETVNANTTTLTNGDSLSDGSTADADVMNVAVTGPTALRTVANIETINLTTTGATAASAITYTVLSGLKTLNISGSAAGNITFTNGGANDIGNTGVTTIDATGLTTNVGIVVNSSQSTATAALTVKGAFGADTINGGLGADVLSGNDGADAIAGGAGADTINGGNGADFLQGQNDGDTINGDAGVDNIDGGAGADILNGGAGNDVIVTTAGNDTVTGGAGNDTIALGALGIALAAGDAATTVIAADATSGHAVVGANATTAAGNNIVKLEGSLAENGADQIIGFTIGATDAATGGDTLNVSAFLGKAVTNYVEISGTDGAADNVNGSNVVVITNSTFAAAQIDDGGAAGDVGVVLGTNAKTVVVEFFETTTTLGATTPLDNAVVRYVTTDANGTIVSNDVVATLVGVTADATNSIAALVAGNFA